MVTKSHTIPIPNQLLFPNQESIFAAEEVHLNSTAVILVSAALRTSELGAND